LQAFATDAVHYRWEDEAGNLVYEGPDNSYELIPEQSTRYFVTITNDRNCYTILATYVEVIPLEIYVPNSFSPNGDGRNDRFQVYGSGIKTLELRIFNRLGEMIYQDTRWIERKNQDSTVGWDGTFQGKSQPVGTYVWSLIGRYINQASFSKTGTFVLLN
ncbi:MAG: gliding motility-associated C-terminal domain-containing protein, partial [Bacteroidia bacterium]|nr:gliding motility-associated C-terminal domain-containing protein [Bacteroidia bacterium]